MNPSIPTAIAADLGATNMRVALVSASGKVIAKLSEPTVKTGENGMAVTRQIIRMIHKMRDAHPPKIIGIGIASIGPLDYQRGGPVRSPNVPFAFIPLIKPLRHVFDLPVLLFNDTNAAALGEYRFGAGKGKKNIVYITLSTGIGAGVIADGKLLLGKSGNAAEVGHVTVDTRYNLPCTCKKGDGHWEAYASGRNIPRFFTQWARTRDKKINHTFQTAKDIFAAGRARDPAVREFLDELSKINARAISNIIVAYDPELITIGGSVALHNASAILGGMKKYVDHYLPTPPITITKLGEDITLLGAAAGLFQ